MNDVLAQNAQYEGRMMRMIKWSLICWQWIDGWNEGRGGNVVSAFIYSVRPGRHSLEESHGNRITVFEDIICNLDVTSTLNLRG